ERSGQPASRGLLAVNAASREAQGSMQGAASRAGIFGSALSALGPAGLAAGAGLGAIALGAARAFQIAREGMDFA
ncbi:MAG TPA: deferrochelatase/peroxidase EfeB, partial [Rhodobiaceae bacterium]|nr:deferrochelatase/peroxidase EfeB [Rhodobiaceae bacterium]